MIAFRPLERGDFPLLQKWLAEPHVSMWWNDPFDLASIEAKYEPRIDGREPVYVFIILHDATPIGWIQWYRWRDFPDHAAQLNAEPTDAGIDLALGEPTIIGRSLGPLAIQTFSAYIFTNTDATAIVTDPAAANLRSVHAFQKAGFTITQTIQLPNESFGRHIVRLDRSDP